MQSTKVLSVRLVNDGMITQPSSPCGVLSPLKYVLVENGRKPEWSNVTGNQSHKPVMRELDEKKLLNGDVIDGIMMEDKKEVDKVILTGAELSKYFGKETTPREMKDQIIKLLDDWKGQQKEHEKPEKKTEQEK